MRHLSAGLLALMLIAAGCSSSGDEAVGSDPVDVLDRSAVAMEAVASARFEMSREGAAVTIQGLAFDGAVGEYGAPDSARAILRMRAGDLAVELGTISIGPRTWLTNPLNGAWEELEAGTGFNPAILFDAEQGWSPLLRTGISGAEYVKTDGGAHVIRGTVGGETISVLTAGIADPQPVSLEVRIDAATGLLRRLEFATSGAEGESSWVIELLDYGLPVQIRAPTVD